MTEFGDLPSWVVDSAGRHEAFDGDAIFRAVYQAALQFGDVDPFRARELTDAILHFLSTSEPGPTISKATIRDTVAKVAGELGHADVAAATSGPAVATQASTDGGSTIRNRPVARSGRLEVMDHATTPPRDDFDVLVAAERHGLLTLWDRDARFKLMAGTVVPRRSGGSADGVGMVEALEAARQHIGQYIAMDGPEYLFPIPCRHDLIRSWVRELGIGLRLTGLRAVINLNCSTAPPWAAEPTGPLFDLMNGREEVEGRADDSDQLLTDLLENDRSQLRVDWHLKEQDLHLDRSRLLRLARWVLQGAPLAFTIDRPRRPVALAEGLDREHAGVLSVVGLRLDGLADYLTRAGTPVRDFDNFGQKLVSLVSLVVAAGRAKRSQLRQTNWPNPGDRLLCDRAQMVIVPLGIREALPSIGGYLSNESEMTRKLLRSIHGAVHRQARSNLTCTMDAEPPLLHHFSQPSTRSSKLPGMSAFRQQLRMASGWQTETGSGTAVLQLPAAHGLGAADIVNLIQFAVQLPGLVRFRFDTSKPIQLVLSDSWT